MIASQAAVTLIRKGDVVQVGQSHTLNVDLLMRDERRFRTKAPDGKSLLEVLKEVDPERQKISVILE